VTDRWSITELTAEIAEYEGSPLSLNETPE